jgi:hypothetical protein
MVSGRGVVKMYYFAIDFGCKMPYPLAPPQGWEAVLIFENLAVSIQRSAFSQRVLATLCRLGFGFGMGGPWADPRATQASPKGHARAILASIGGSTFVCNKGAKKAGWGVQRSGHLVIARDRKTENLTTDSHG